MTLKASTLLAFVGTLLITAYLTWTFVFRLLDVLRNVEAPAVLVSLFIYAFGAFTLTVFLFVFHRSQP